MLLVFLTSLLVSFFYLSEVSCELLFTGQAAQVVADHLKGSLGCLAAGPEIDQQARDDRAVTLDFIPILTVQTDQKGGE